MAKSMIMFGHESIHVCGVDVGCGMLSFLLDYRLHRHNVFTTMAKPG